MRNRQKESSSRYIMTANFDPRTYSLTAAMATSVANPDAGVDAIRLLDGRMLLIANPTHQERTPLVLFLSEWRNEKINLALEPSERGFRVSVDPKRQY